MYYNESFFSVLNHNLFKMLDIPILSYCPRDGTSTLHPGKETFIRRLPCYHGFLVMYYGNVMVFLF